MALTVGTNSWVTVADADAYFLTKWGATAIWAALSEAQKESLLISAYNWIQQQSKFSIAASETAEIVKQAQYETAWFMYNYYAEYQKRNALYSSGVRDFKIDSFEEELEKPVFPLEISDMLHDYISSSAGGVFPRISRDLSQN